MVRAPASIDSPGDSPRSEPIAALHADVDRATRRLHVLHAARLQCREGCSSCCVDDLTVFEVEAAQVRRHHEELLATGAPHAEGACAFLDERGACRIYADRPYVCRTQGLPLRWIDEDDDGTSERRDICPLNEEGEPITELHADACWTLGPVEERLALLQLAAAPGSARVRLRDLFATACPPIDERAGLTE
jgi:Fe-S-cluster containining protein